MSSRTGRSGSLAPAFVVAYGTDELKEAEVASVFLEAVEAHEQVSLDDAVRSYLKALQRWLDMYPEIGATSPHWSVRPGKRPMAGQPSSPAR